MKNIVNPFITRLIANLEFDNTRLIRVLQDAGKSIGEIFRILDYMSGGELPELAQTRENEKERLTMTYYDVFDDQVLYTGQKRTTRWFATQEEADACPDTMEDNYNLPGHSFKNDRYTFSHEVWYNVSGHKYRYDWEK